MTAPDRIRQLVETFEQNIHEYHSRKNETELRRQFLDPFFEALGWDVDNKKGADERNKEVAHEYSVEIDGQQKKADYAFRTGRDTFDFLVEAKKPSVRIESNFEAAYQIRRYGWSAGLSINILTDFEHFAIYDCRKRPNYSQDKVNTGLIEIIHYKEFVDRWHEIADLFSPEAIRKGALDQYKDSLKGKKGTQEVDDAFLEEIENWREMLARNIATRNKHLNLNEDQVNFAVQMTIDRIIFLRISEERGMEKDRRLFELSDDEDIYNNLLELFRQADARYNSGLFHFKRDRNRENPDTLTTELDVDNKVLRDIIKDLYYPSPYAFNYIPTEILGSVYERFLGKVIRLTAGGNAKVEEKPEVRKAGGVYYTPTYIVEYIVRNTVGKLLEDKTLDEVSKLRIVDPACGSGSFLLGAYQYLLDWHLDWYVKNDLDKQLKKKSLLTADQKTYRLSIDEKKRILLNNIHGVDLDTQAVEVTKLSLLLKVVEDPGQLKMFEEGHILPNLNQNIRNGNALIGTDYFSGQMFGDMDAMKRVKPFDWKDEFPEVFRRGGFDAVIGNPPYGAELSNEDIEYTRLKFEVISKDVDTYALFIEKSISLSKPGGKVSMIVPTGWYSGARFSKLRRLFASWTDLEIIVNLPYDIFSAWVDTTVFVADKREARLEWPRKLATKTRLITFPKRFLIKSQEDYENKEGNIDIADWFSNGNDEFLTYADTKTVRIIKKIEYLSRPLSEMADVQRGVTPFNLEDAPQFATSEPAFYGTVRRYSLDRGESKYIRFDKTLAEYKPERYFKGPRLLLRELISRQFRLQAVRTNDDFITNKSMQSILQLPNSPDINYLLGMINSQLTSWYFLSKSNIGQRDDFPKIVLKETRRLPIRTINFNDPAEKSMHEQMVSLVERMLALHKNVARDGIPPNEKELLQRQIKSTDRQIDELVYQLYDLSEEEIKIIEG